MAHEGMEGTGHPAKHLRDGRLRTLDTFFEVTVTGPLAQSNVASAAAAAGGALEKAFKRKVEGAAQACQEQGISFLPFALETLGGFH